MVKEEKEHLKIIIFHNFEEYPKLSLIDSNQKFEVFYEENKIIIKASDFSSLRAGVNAVIKELIILEKLKNLKNNLKTC